MDEETYNELAKRLNDGLDDMGIDEYVDVLIISRPKGSADFGMYYETENIGGLIGMMEIAKMDLIKEITADE